MRIVKDPAERKQEIMDMAAQLFMSKGYEETSVNLIVEQLGVAKGTFYHYFKSKEELLEAVLENYLSQYAEGIQRAVQSNVDNAYEKLLLVLRGILLNTKGPEHLTRHVEDNKNARLHQAMDEKFFEKFYPIILGVLKQGVEENIFHMEHPEEITEILLIGIRGYMHIHLPNFSSPEYAQKKIRALEELFNKALGISEERYKIHLI